MIIMYQIDFNKPANIHFIGIGGISMSGLAELLCSNGFRITGSDSHESDITDHLETLGIKIYYGQRPENIAEDTDLVVYTAAISPDNPEYMEAVNKKIPMLVRADMIGQIMKNYQNAIAVAGTHGKTTTTSLLTHIYVDADLDPTVSVGATLDILHGNVRVGGSKNWIMEACEYTNSFLSFNPTVSIILNIEEDHLDFFKDINDIRHSFRLFAEKLPADGILIINKDIDNYEEICQGLPCKVVTYSSKDSSADYYSANITYNERDCGSYDLYVRGEKKGHPSLNIIGEHNVSNSLAAIAAAYEQGVSLDNIKLGLKSFHGADRRFQIKGDLAGITIVDDYAHHPSEIAATLKSAATFPNKSVWCVFQPHTYTRTKAFLKEFAASLSLADHVIVTDIYAAREKDPGDISSKDLYNEMVKLGVDCYYISDFEEIKNFILTNCVNGDMLITMGAGDVVTIGDDLLGY